MNEKFSDITKYCYQKSVASHHEIAILSNFPVNRKIHQFLQLPQSPRISSKFAFVLRSTLISIKKSLEGFDTKKFNSKGSESIVSISAKILVYYLWLTPAAASEFALPSPSGNSGANSNCNKVIRRRCRTA